MPTGGTARFGSALSVHHFLRTMPVVGLSPANFQALGPAAVHIANAEGLAGHAGAVQVRLDRIAAQTPGRGDLRWADLRELLLPHIRQLGAYQGVAPLEGHGGTGPEFRRKASSG